MYFSDVNNTIPPTQAETVLATPNNERIGIPTTVNAVPTIEIPLITPTELVPVDAYSILIFPLLFRIFALKIHNVCMIFPHCLNVETFLTH